MTKTTTKNQGVKVMCLENSYNPGMKTLKEYNCHIVFEYNNVLGCINGYLTKTDGTLGFIKAFVYNTETDCVKAATRWANNNPRSLRNAKWGESLQPDKINTKTQWVHKN